MIQITAERKGPEPTSLNEGKALVQKDVDDYMAIAKLALPQDQVEAKLGECFKNIEIKSKYYATDEVKRRLYESHYGKCAYCETRIIHSQYGDVEHFRPKKGVVTRDGEGNLLPPIHAYFWRAFNWNNLVLSCGTCNQAYKRNFFDLLPNLKPSQGEEGYSGVGKLELEPLAPKRETPTNIGAVSEYPILIDPCAEDPRLLIAFDIKGQAHPSPLIDLSQGDPGLNFARADRTIKVMGLNRAALVEMRHRHVLLLHSVFMLALNNWQSLMFVKELGTKIMRQREISAAHDLGDLVRARANHGDLSQYAAQALEVLGWLVHPGAEYSAMAADVFSQWCVEESTVVETATVQAASQPAATALLAVGATENLYMKYPKTILDSLKIQARDYSDVLSKHFQEREPESIPIRAKFYERMNELIVRYRENYRLLAEFSGLDREKRILRKFKECVSDYYDLIMSRQEQFNDELNPKPHPDEDAWATPGLGLPRPGPDDEAARRGRERTMYLLEATNQILAYLAPFFDWAKKVDTLANARQNFAGNLEPLNRVNEECQKAIAEKADDRNVQIYVRSWAEDHNFFLTESRDYLSKGADEEVFEDLRTEFASINTDLTILLFEVNTSGVDCTAITKEREGTLKEALKMILGWMVNHTDPMPAETELTIIKVRTG